MYKKLLDKHASTATSHHNLAVMHLTLRSNPGVDYETQMFRQHVHTTNSFHMLGAVHHKINDFTCCRQNFGYEFFQYNVGSSEPGSSGIFVEGLANGEETSKGDQLGIPNIISNIGNVYYKMGDYRSATKQFQEAVDLYNKLIDKHKRRLLLEA